MVQGSAVLCLCLCLASLVDAFTNFGGHVPNTRLSSEAEAFQEGTPEHAAYIRELIRKVQARERTFSPSGRSTDDYFDQLNARRRKAQEEIEEKRSRRSEGQLDPDWISTEDLQESRKLMASSPQTFSQSYDLSAVPKPGTYKEMLQKSQGNTATNVVQTRPAPKPTAKQPDLESSDRTIAIKPEVDGAEKPFTKEEEDLMRNAFSLLVKHRGGGPMGPGRLPDEEVPALVEALSRVTEYLREEARRPQVVMEVPATTEPTQTTVRPNSPPPSVVVDEPVPRVPSSVPPVQQTRTPVRAVVQTTEEYEYGDDSDDGPPSPEAVAAIARAARQTREAPTRQKIPSKPSVDMPPKKKVILTALDLLGELANKGLEEPDMLLLRDLLIETLYMVNSRLKERDGLPDFGVLEEKRQ